MAKETDMKKILEDQTEKLTEIFDDRIKSVTEQYNDINKKFAKIDRTLNSHTEEIGKLKVGVEETRINVSENKKDIKEIRIDSIEIKRDIKEVKFWVATDSKNKVDKKHFVDLEGRVRKLEKK